MLSQESNFSGYRPKKARLLSDWALIYGLMHTKLFIMLFTNFKKAIWQLIVQFFQANRSLLSYAYTSVMRFKPGSMAGGGVLQTIAILCLIVAYNLDITPYWKVLTPFIACGLPFIPFYTGLEGFQELVLVDIETPLLLIYGAVFLISSTVHILTNWFGYADKSVSSRGTGYLYLLLTKSLGQRIPINEFVVYFFECLIVTAIGSYLIWAQIDPYFGGWLIAISLSEGHILLFERSVQFQQRRILNA